MNKNDKVMLGAILSVFIATGIMMVFILKDKFPPEGRKSDARSGQSRVRSSN